MTPRRGGLDVRGGAGGITAQCEQITALAGSFGAAAGDSLHSAFDLHGYLLHPGLDSSALFDPIGFGRFEADLLDALDGPRGLSWAGLQCGAVDAELRVAALAYEGADHLGTRLHDDVLGLLLMPRGLLAGTAVLASTGDPLAAAQAAVAADPQAADTVLDRLGLPQLLELGASALPDGHGVAHPLEVSAAAPPRRLTDLLTGLAARNDDPHHGAVDVRVLTLADGSRRVVVDITGTKSWTPGPTSDVTSLTTNGRALTGRAGAYEQGVLAAMRRAGVRAGDPVMMVGHSEGGMVAVTAARDAVLSGEFRVTHVITAGSPIGRSVASLPRSVQVLALENAKDVVPHLDGVANPDEPNVTTVSSAHGDGSVIDDHDIADSYTPLAGDVERSDATSVRHFLTSAKDWFGATSARTHAFQITRQY